MREKGLIDVYILEILENYSSINRRLTQQDIISYLDRDYNIVVSRNTLSKYLFELKEGKYINGTRGVYFERKLSILGSPEPPVRCLRATLPEKQSHFHYGRATL